jgi:hypothetical protein
MQNMAEGGPIYKSSPLPAARRGANEMEKDNASYPLAFEARSSALSCCFKWTMGWAELQELQGEARFAKAPFSEKATVGQASTSGGG